MRRFLLALPVLFLALSLDRVLPERPAAAAPRRNDRRFYTVMAAVIALTVFAGFALIMLCCTGLVLLM